MKEKFKAAVIGLKSDLKLLNAAFNALDALRKSQGLTYTPQPKRKAVVKKVSHKKRTKPTLKSKVIPFKKGRAKKTK